MIVGIIGIGLIGGSLAISLKESGLASHVIGIDACQANLDKAVRRRLIDEDLPLGEALSACELIVLATPMDAMLTLLPDLLDRVGAQQTLVDVGSTKETLLELVKNHPNRGRFVACHPMAGTEFSGPEAAVPNLFTGKTCVIVDAQDSAPDAVDTAKRVFGSAGMRFTHLDRCAHDLHCAYVSHISHIASFALALTVLEKEKDEQRIFELASSGFGSTVRLAKSSADMWVPIFRQNRDHVLDVLDEHIEQLSRFRTQLIKRDFEGFHARIERANQIEKILK
ncbi:Cyclohexadienyl dehydrogenase [Neolewinella maritima]|uniref:Cyclohexadienyl dehydrogenase n=1 Tax=Neolewinella maritima TaxID=1383882 RepID=A0ABM9B015_9BACT|nr:prephenate dehydrogenase [Neolewinella maritima]CAH1000092.1 Cyclohexadienyl dehydrogenase [Neolewinella maritima]